MNARQFTKAGRWLLLKADSGMFSTMEGVAPRQGHTD